MKLRDHYDWVVLGDHPGALLSAALAARLGLSVLVLPVFPGKSISVAEDGRFVDPEPNYLLSLGRVPQFNGLLSECLGRLGILPAELEQVQRSEPLPQVLTPEFRLAFGGAGGSDFGRLEQELSRELGKGAAQKSGLVQALKRAEPDYLGYWLALPERLTLAADKKKTAAPGLRFPALKRRIAKSVTGPEQARWLDRARHASRLARELGVDGVTELLAGVAYGAGGNLGVDPSLDEVLHLLALARTGASFKGGMGAYREFLERLAKRLGAHLPPELECKRVFVDQGRFTGVQVANRANVISGGGAVVGCALSQLKTLVSQSGRSLWRGLKPSPAPSGWRFTISFIVDERAIPPGASPRMIWQEREAPPIEIEIADAEPHGLSSGKRDGSRAIQARTVLPYEPETLTLEYQRRIAARLFRQLSEIFPFVEPHVRGVFPEFRPESAARTELAQVYGFAGLEWIPENLRVFAHHAGRSGVGSRSGVEGLFVATGESFPELGSLGSTVAALEAVSWLAHRAGLAGPLA
jgi:phytoene dehydrogenase-like protein